MVTVPPNRSIDRAPGPDKEHIGFVASPAAVSTPNKAIAPTERKAAAPTAEADLMNKEAGRMRKFIVEDLSSLATSVAGSGVLCRQK